MNMLKAATCLAFAVLYGTMPALSQAHLSSGEIRSAEANRVIGVRIEVHATDAPLYIAVCGSDEVGDHSVCGLAMRLQKRTGSGWRTVSVRKELLAVLGGVAPDAWTPLRIAPGESAFLTFTIDPEQLDVQRGDELRVDLDS